MDVTKHDALEIGQNPFYRPSNNEYGEPWLSTQEKKPQEIAEIPSYSELVSTFASPNDSLS